MSIGRTFSRRVAAVIVTGCLAALSALSQPASAVVLSYTSIDTPSLAVFNGRLFMAYAGTDGNHRLNYAVSSDGLTFSQVTDPNNRAGGGPAITVFNGTMYVVFPGINDHAINIASSTDGQHYSGQFVINGNWNTPWRPALGAGGGKLYIAWLGYDNALYIASSTDGLHFSISGSVPPHKFFGEFATSYVAYPPTLAPPNSSSTPQMVFTYSQGQVNAPNSLYICMESATINGILHAPCGTCVNAIATRGGVQGGLGYLPGESLMGWIVNNPSSGSLDVRGGNCVAGGSRYSLSGVASGVAPAVAGFNGHAYYAWTGTGAQNINIIQAL